VRFDNAAINVAGGKIVIALLGEGTIGE